MSAVYLPDQRRRGRVFIALAALAWSTAGLLQRELSVGTGTQLAGRSLFAVLALTAYVGVAERGHVVKGFRAIGRGGIAVAFFTAVASASFIVALNHATVANVLFVQALAPIVAAVLGTVLGDPVPRRSWLAIAAGLIGVAVMVGGPGRPSLVGEGLSVLMALAFAGALVITRHRRDVSMAPATCLSQLIVLAVAAPFSHPREIQGHDLTLLILLGVGQIGLGLVFLSIGARLIPAAEVALITLLEVVLGPLWVWLALSETPSAATLVGGAIVMLAVATQTLVGTPQSALPKGPEVVRPIERRLAQRTRT
jgi:drug/metabolite transporter (DMT)-like permease